MKDDNETNGRMPMDIQPYDGADIRPLVEIWERSVAATHTFLSAADFDYYKRNMPDYLQAVKLYVCRDADGTPAGFMGLSADTIEMLFVHPDNFKRGVGRALVGFAFGRGITRVDVNEQNEGALAFYRRMGFVPVGRDAVDGDGKPYPVIHMKQG